MNRALTDFQVDILALANEGLSNRQIAEAVSRPFACIITTFTNIKRKGHRLPEHRPLDATAERAHRVRERQNIEDCKAAPRFTAKGRKKSTGEKFEVTSDSQAFADAHLVAMLQGFDAPLISGHSQIHKKPVVPGARSHWSHARKTLIDHTGVFQMHNDGMTPAAIGERLGVRAQTIYRILGRRTDG